MKVKLFIILLLPFLFMVSCKRESDKKRGKTSVKVQSLGVSYKKKKNFNIDRVNNLKVGDKVKVVDFDSSIESSFENEGVFLGREGMFYFVRFDDGHIEGLKRQSLKKTEKRENIDAEEAELTRLKHFCRIVSIDNMVATYRDLYDKRLFNKLKNVEDQFLRNKKRCLKDLMHRDDFDSAAIISLNEARRRFVGFAHREYEVEDAKDAEKWILGGISLDN